MLFYSLIVAYVFGGLTFIPVALLLWRLFLWLASPFRGSLSVAASRRAALDAITMSSSRFHRMGRLRVTTDDQVVLQGLSLGGMVKSYLSGKKKKADASPETCFFAVLKYSTLFLYDSEQRLDCKDVITLSHYAVHIHPTGLQDHELFSKAHYIKLWPKAAQDTQSAASAPRKSYYINCLRCVDKEDWYFSLLQASRLDVTSNDDLPKQGLQDTTRFDQDAMNVFLSTIHSDEHHFQTQWFNALMGRVFFGLYKTDTVQGFFRQKVITKIKKLNTRRPSFLGEISVRSVDPGHAIPMITQPRLLGLSPSGEFLAEMHIQYDGSFRFEIETELKWKYADKLPPLTIDVVLAVTLKFLRGTLQVKMKEPPTNRAWIGFCDSPTTEWIVEPVVWEKRIGYSVVSKAIQSKLQELINDTMVLPNMDDIVFFRTGGAGGIFDTTEKSDVSPSADLAEEVANHATREANQALDDTQAGKPPCRRQTQSLPELLHTPGSTVATPADVLTLPNEIPNEVIDQQSTRSKEDAQNPPPRKKWFGKKAGKQLRTSDDELLRQLAVYATPHASTSSTSVDATSTSSDTVVPKTQDSTGMKQSEQSLGESSDSRSAEKEDMNKETMKDDVTFANMESIIECASQRMVDELQSIPSLDSQTDHESSCDVHDISKPDGDAGSDTTKAPGSQAISTYTSPTHQSNMKGRKNQLKESPGRLRSKSLPSTALSKVNAGAATL